MAIINLKPVLLCKVSPVRISPVRVTANKNASEQDSLGDEQAPRGALRIESCDLTFYSSQKSAAISDSSALGTPSKDPFYKIWANWPHLTTTKEFPFPGIPCAHCWSSFPYPYFSRSRLPHCWLCNANAICCSLYRLLPWILMWCHKLLHLHCRNKMKGLGSRRRIRTHLTKYI